jgi:FMN phosphatase YigB (HAD superfamily)
MFVTSPPKALAFDVFGTVVDWRTSITREVDDLARRKGSMWTPQSSPMRGVLAICRP